MKELNKRAYSVRQLAEALQKDDLSILKTIVKLKIGAYLFIERAEDASQRFIPFSYEDISGRIKANKFSDEYIESESDGYMTEDNLGEEIFVEPRAEWRVSFNLAELYVDNISANLIKENSIKIANENRGKSKSEAHRIGLMMVKHFYASLTSKNDTHRSLFRPDGKGLYDEAAASYIHSNWKNFCSRNGEGIDRKILDIVSSSSKDTILKKIRVLRKQKKDV